MKFKCMWCLGISTKINLIVCKLHLGDYEGWRRKAVAKYSNKPFLGCHAYIDWLRFMSRFMVWVHIKPGLCLAPPVTISLICYPKAPLLFRLLLSHIFSRAWKWKSLPFLWFWLLSTSVPITNSCNSWIQQCWQKNIAAQLELKSELYDPTE